MDNGQIFIFCLPFCQQCYQALETILIQHASDEWIEMVDIYLRDSIAVINIIIIIINIILMKQSYSPTFS